jgi:hypothetical protein
MYQHSLLLVEMAVGNAGRLVQAENVMGYVFYNNRDRVNILKALAGMEDFTQAMILADMYSDGWEKLEANTMDPPFTFATTGLATRYYADVSVAKYVRKRMRELPPRALPPGVFLWGGVLPDRQRFVVVYDAGHLGLHFVWGICEDLDDMEVMSKAFRKLYLGAQSFEEVFNPSFLEEHILPGLRYMHHLSGKFGTLFRWFLSTSGYDHVRPLDSLMSILKNKQQRKLLGERATMDIFCGFSNGSPSTTSVLDTDVALDIFSRYKTMYKLKGFLVYAMFPDKWDEFLDEAVLDPEQFRIVPGALLDAGLYTGDPHDPLNFGIHPFFLQAQKYRMDMSATRVEWLAAVERAGRRLSRAPVSTGGVHVKGQQVPHRSSRKS